MVVYRLASLPEDRFPKKFSEKWNVKPRKGRQKKTWDKVVGDLFVALSIDKW